MRSINADKIVVGLPIAELIEDYPTYLIGPAVLVLFYDDQGVPHHALWGIARGAIEPAVLITAYRPDLAEWTADFKTRRP